jgi:serine protease Do
MNTTNTTVINELESAARTVAASAANAVVQLGRDGRGTGFVVADGKVLTNAHNLRNATIQVAFANGSEIQGQVHAVDPEGDLAVISVDTTGSHALVWSDQLPEQGSLVLALSPSQTTLRVTFGMVSATDRTFTGPRGRTINGSIEHTAPLARGASGGPLLSIDGRVVGINTHRLGDGFYIALPADANLQARVAKLISGESVSPRRLGVALATPEVAAQLRKSVGLPERSGLLVRSVQADAPGANAGIQEGDLLVGAGGQSLGVVADLENALDALTGSTIEIQLVRGVEEQTVTVSFA